MAVDSPEYPPDKGNLVPTTSDHALSSRPDAIPQASAAGRTSLVLALAGPPLQVARTPEADTDLGMRPQPHEIGLIELTAATPTPRRRRLRRLIRSSHNLIINPSAGGGAVSR